MYPKDKSHLLAKKCLDVAQQGETKYDGRNSTNKQYSRFFLYPDFFWIFPKGTSRNQDFFLFFYYFVLYFFWTRITKYVTTKIGNYNWGQMWSTEIRQVLWKACKTLVNFFLYFPEFFWQFWWDQTSLHQVWVGSKWCQETAVKISDFSDKRTKSYACFTKGILSYIFQKAQHGGGGGGGGS